MSDLETRIERLERKVEELSWRVYALTALLALSMSIAVTFAGLRLLSCMAR